MARITVEDCLEQVENRFELVLMGAKRARQIAKGAEPTLPEENDKPTVIALREIAEQTLNAHTLSDLDRYELQIEEPEIEEPEPDDE